MLQSSHNKNPTRNVDIKREIHYKSRNCQKIHITSKASNDPSKSNPFCIPYIRGRKYDHEPHQFSFQKEFVQ